MGQVQAPACCDAPLASFDFQYVIVGGGVAAGYACREFVEQQVTDRILVVSDDHNFPYERPALTKAYLHPPDAGVRTRLPEFNTCADMGGKPQNKDWYHNNGIIFLWGRATKLNIASKIIHIGQDVVQYGKLIIATGSRAVRLSEFGIPGESFQNVFHIRSEADAAQVVKALEQFRTKLRVVVIGGGYIGMECAAAISGWGGEVKLVMPGSHLMPQLFNSELASWLEAKFQTHGIELIKDMTVKKLLGSEGAVSAVELVSGQKLECNVVIVGIGAKPNTDWAHGAQPGFKGEKGGIAVDSRMRTSDPSVWACGDVCAFESLDGKWTRIEHVDHARKSAVQAMRSAIGLSPESYEYVPFLYSRMFEYTDRPVVFYFAGLQTGELQTAKTENGIIGIWVSQGKIHGSILMGSPGPVKADAAKMREVALSRPSASGGPIFALGAWGIS